MKFCLHFVWLFVGFATAIQWQDSNDVRYSLDCDFYGNDLRSQRSTGEQCGPLCSSDGYVTAVVLAK